MADKIKIAYLYEDLMNTYGDSGDVKILRYLLNQQGYQVDVDNVMAIILMRTTMILSSSAVVRTMNKPW